MGFYLQGLTVSTSNCFGGEDNLKINIWISRETVFWGDAGREIWDESLLWWLT